MTAIADHIAILMIHAASDGENPPSTFVDLLRPQLRKKYELDISDEVIDLAFEKLVKSGAARKIGSDLAGNMIAIVPENFLSFFEPDTREPSSSTSVEYDARYNAAHDNLSVAEGYVYGGQDWIDRVVARLQSGEFEGARSTLSVSQIPVPAADRIVTIDDNQRGAVDAAVEEVFNALVRENSVDGDISLRDRFLAQLAASRELIRASSVRAYLVYDTLVRLLGTLIEKYKDQALAEAAKKLLDLLVEHIFGK